jgi:hypothetical protein
MNSYEQVMEVLDKWERNLSKKKVNPVFKGDIVHIIHEDGSTISYINAIMVKFRDWVLVSTEHNGRHIFAKDDLSFYSQYKRTDLEEVDLDGKALK